MNHGEYLSGTVKINLFSCFKFKFANGLYQFLVSCMTWNALGKGLIAVKYGMGVSFFFHCSAQSFPRRFSGVVLGNPDDPPFGSQQACFSSRSLV